MELTPAAAKGLEPKDKRNRYITPQEVSMHNRPSDCWVSFLGRVYDITAVVSKEEDALLALPIINRAGMDISDWFDPKTQDIRRHIDVSTNLETYYTPMGRFVDIPLSQPTTKVAVTCRVPWWKDKKYYIGELASRTQMIRIRNVLTNQEAVMEVPEDEIMTEVRERYLKYNSHAKSYTFKTMNEQSGTWIWRDLLMNKTLAENGIVNQAADFVKCKLLRNYYIPVIHAYFNDDLTVS